MPFSTATFNFLSENYARNDKAWYNEHKDDYKKYVVEPFAAFVSELEPYIYRIDERLVCLKRSSRLYRDARYAKGLSIFRDNVWCSFGLGQVVYEGPPEFFFEISPRGYQYGFGYYCASADSMEAIRGLILDGDPDFAAADTAARGSVFELWGDLYKRSRHPDCDAGLREWLDRRSLCLGCQGADAEFLLGDDLAKKVGEDFLSISPVYDFFMKAEARVARK